MEPSVARLFDAEEATKQWVRVVRTERASGMELGATEGVGLLIQQSQPGADL